jgi:alpha-glucosidase
VFPGRGQVTWRDWYTHDIVQASANGSVTLSAPLGHINVHFRDGAAILMHAKPAYTIYETRHGPFALLVSLDSRHQAFGTAYLDDGESYPPGPSRELTITASVGEVRIKGRGTFHVDQELDEVTVLGAFARPQSVSMNGKGVRSWDYFARRNKLVVRGLGVDLNQPVVLKWNCDCDHVSVSKKM